MIPLRLSELWAIVETFEKRQRESGEFANARREQNIPWMRSLLEEAALRHLYAQDSIASRLLSSKGRWLKATSPLEAVERLLG